MTRTNMNQREIKLRAWINDKMFYFDLVHAHQYRWDDDTFMQFTGLVDKQGKEIYEGDIVKTRYGQYKVTWNDRNSGFDPFRGDINCPYSKTESEIIGNIYENPELLNK